MTDQADGSHLIGVESSAVSIFYEVPGLKELPGTVQSPIYHRKIVRRIYIGSEICLGLFCFECVDLFFERTVRINFGQVGQGV